MPRRPVLVLDDDDDEVTKTVSAWKLDEAGNIIAKDSKQTVAVNETGIIGGATSDLVMDPSEIFYDDEGGSDSLGRGACGMVSKAIHQPTGTRLAIKRVKVEDKAKRDQLMNDITALVKAEHSPNLVKLYSAFVVKKQDTVQVVLELMDLGSLADMKASMVVQESPKRRPKYFLSTWKSIPEAIVANMTAQMLEGLQALHSSHQLHRDIKPQNILINTQGWVKLADFGIARELGDTMAVANTFVGTSTYMSPERATGQPYSFQADIWAIGIVIYELAAGEYPFKNVSSFPALFDALCNKPEPRLDPNVFSPELCEVIERTVVKEESRRLLSPQLLDGPFCKSQCTREELVAWLRKVMPPEKFSA